MSTPYLGEIRIFGFQRVPHGWASCDGSLLSIAQNDALYSLVGTTYGGDGQTTFGLPDLRGQLPLHNGQGPGLTTRTIGEFGGAETVTLLPAQLPSHSHGFSATTTTASSASPGAAYELGAVSGDAPYATALDVTTATLSPNAITATGGTQPHDNTMPTLTAQYCIALEGIYPPQN
jgi:microcystin-dependent protein